MPDPKLILAMTAVSACLPSVATVRIQRKEQDAKQLTVLGLCGGIALMVIVGAIAYEPLMYVGLLCMILAYLYFMLAPKESV